MTPKPVRTPPHDNQAEQALLGGLMLSPAAYDRIADRLTEPDFYRETHGLIFRAIGELRENNQPCDAVTVGEWFQRHGKSDLVEGGAYLSMLVTETPGPTNAVAYADIIREKSILRQLVEIGSGIADSALAGGGPDLVEQAWKRLESLALPAGGGPVPVMQAAGEWLDYLSLISDGRIEPVNSGLTDWDRLIGGMYPGQVHVVAGRPAMGKSLLGGEIAQHVGRSSPVLWWSGEMARTQLVGRLVQGAGVSSKLLRTPQLMAEQDWTAVQAALAGIKGLQIHIDDTPALNVNTLLLRTRQAVRRHGIKVLIVDYLQLLTAKGENRNNEIGVISRGLKRIAQDCEIPVVALSQLNRDCEKRPDKKPHMADLRDGGDIEQVAESITFIFWNGHYNHDDDSQIAELIVSKHRNGSPGTAHVLRLPERTRMVNADRELIAEYRRQSGPVKRFDNPYKRSGVAA